MASALALVAVSFSIVLWKALSTCQALAVLAAATTVQERKEAFNAALPAPSALPRKPKPQPRDDDRVQEGPIVGLSSQV